jgi:hypothetical protein
MNREGAAVGRGGVLKDALSNKPMQRSANRTARMNSWCRPRPLIATLGFNPRILIARIVSIKILAKK